MAGTVADCELSAGVSFAVATTAQDASIRQLLRDNPIRGAVNVAFQREPDYFQGENIAGGEDRTIVAFRNRRLVCMGRCTQRECWVNGQPMRAGYLAELRLDATVRGQFGILRDGYRFFQSLQADNPADLYFTSIASDNSRAQRLLESGMRGLPSYDFLSELETLLVAVPRNPRPGRLSVRTPRSEDIPTMVRLLNSHGRRHNFSTVWTVENLLALEEHGLPLDRFLLALDGNEIVGCGALWDQRSFKQTAVLGYSPVLTKARPVVNAIGPLFGIPPLPRPGSILAHAFLSPIAFSDGASAMLFDFIHAFFLLAAQTGLEFITLALPASDRRIPKIRQRFCTRAWRSRVYQVKWPEQRNVDLGRIDIFPEVALL